MRATRTTTTTGSWTSRILRRSTRMSAGTATATRCDDCAVGTDNFGTQSDSLPGNNDGTDTDSDGQCNAGDTDDDNDTCRTPRMTRR